ncbi:unnamed protein product [Dibothriocephalus latus]|uniref:Uncharacterized protein n=1 Tax=Dibothriocephalus latus TaxID=60516 RepID=A0A3P7MDJ3_DIBLA|nr:unnamed protein product [Dibothriocephalus latus]
MLFEFSSLVPTHASALDFVVTSFQHGRFPTTYADKRELKKMINSAASDLLEKCQARGETLEPLFELTNFQEACRAVNTAVIETKIPPDVAQIFDECPGSLPADGTFYSCSSDNVSISSCVEVLTLPQGRGEGD